MRIPLATELSVTDDYLVVELTDGRILSIPLEWFPKLRNAAPEQRANHRLIGRGTGIHWPELDEHLSVEGFLLGNKSPEGIQKIEPLGDSDNPVDDSPFSTNPYFERL